MQLCHVPHFGKEQLRLHVVIQISVGMFTKHCGCNFVVAQMKSALKLCTKAKFGDLLLTLAKAPNNHPHYGVCVLIWQMNMNYILRIDLVSTIHVITMRISCIDYAPCWNLNWARTFWSIVHPLGNFLEWNVQIYTKFETDEYYTSICKVSSKCVSSMYHQCTTPPYLNQI